MFGFVRKMRERPGEVGKFEVSDGGDMLVGRAEFSHPEEYLAVADSTWGRLEVRSFVKESTQAVSVNGRLIATVVVSGLATKLIVKLASGKEVSLKHALFSDIYRYSGDLGAVEFRIRKVLDDRKIAECSVAINDFLGGKPEDLALALMAWYGFMHVSSRETMRQLGS